MKVLQKNLCWASFSDCFLTEARPVFERARWEKHSPRVNFLGAGNTVENEVIQVRVRDSVLKMLLPWYISTSDSWIGSVSQSRGAFSPLLQFNNNTLSKKKRFSLSLKMFLLPPSINPKVRKAQSDEWVTLQQNN